MSQNVQYFLLLMWGYIRCMHARPHRRKDQLPLRSLSGLHKMGRKELGRPFWSNNLGRID